MSGNVGKHLVKKMGKNTPKSAEIRLPLFNFECSGTPKNKGKVRIYDAFPCFWIVIPSESY